VDTYAGTSDGAADNSFFSLTVDASIAMGSVEYVLLVVFSGDIGSILA
jgi:hypothetical protein